MMNGKQRARWLADMISEAQRYISKAREAPEVVTVRKAVNLLDDARHMAVESDTEIESQS